MERGLWEYQAIARGGENGGEWRLQNTGKRRAGLQNAVETYASGRSAGLL